MRRLLFFLPLCLFNGFLMLPASCKDPLMPNNSMHFELIRRRPNVAKTRLEHVGEIVRSDNLRTKMIAERIGRRRKSCEVDDHGNRKGKSKNRTSSFAMPMSSGAYTGTGQYFVRFRVGTPAQKFLLVADTGSDLTWMKCRRRPPCRKCGKPRRRRVFYANDSSSFSPIRCSSRLCKNSLPFSLTKCPTPTSPCTYDYRYADGSTAQGIFANESATIPLSNGHKAKLEGIVVGCTSSFVGSSFRASDGVLGLGYSETSFAAQASARFGGKFSYCLVDHLSPKNRSDYLVFGENTRHRSSRHRRYAELLIEPRLQPFYAVRVAGISVGGEILNISRVVWDANRGGGVILDSGTSLTVLAEPAYRAVMAALSQPLRKYPRVEVHQFEFCFDWRSAGGGSSDELAVPRLAVHLRGFGGGLARLEPPVNSYLIDVADGVKCIGFLSSSSWPGVSTIGNILQQSHLWEFDVAEKRLGFEPSTCASSHSL